MSVINLKSKLRNKYRAKQVKLDGYTFDSIAESRYYLLLKERAKQGEITDLKVHPRFILRSHRGKTIGQVEMDFSFISSGHAHVIDIKGMDNALSAWKRGHFQADYPEVHFELIWSGRRK